MPTANIIPMADVETQILGVLQDSPTPLLLIELQETLKKAGHPVGLLVLVLAVNNLVTSAQIRRLGGKRSMDRYQVAI